MLQRTNGLLIAKAAHRPQTLRLLPLSSRRPGARARARASAYVCVRVLGADRAQTKIPIPVEPCGGYDLLVSLFAWSPLATKADIRSITGEQDGLDAPLPAIVRPEARKRRISLLHP
eukprot:6194283-Pleurochrysis_carterae.AAC.2